MNEKQFLMLKILAAFIILLIAAMFFNANKASKGIYDSVKNSQKELSSKIECSDIGCKGAYGGPEFVNNSDIAHQFSNLMANKVGDKLKELYDNLNYCKVDFSKIEMSTEGMGSGSVVFRLKIPFEKVGTRCDAYTSFDHVGGWNHQPALAKRRNELKNVLLENEKLDISELKSTPEGLQEYWIQWKNKKSRRIVNDN